MFRRVENLCLDTGMRSLCRKPYPGHRKGCPNYGKGQLCPPNRPRVEDVLDIDRPFYAIWGVFDLASHVERMREKHPAWSWRQLVCCLYWQPTARKRLKEEIKRVQQIRKELQIEMIPEAMGINVTRTMSSIGEYLEWPPRTKTYQVVIAGTPLVRKKRLRDTPRPLFATGEC